MTRSPTTGARHPAPINCSSLKDPPACYSPWTPLSSYQWDNFSPPQWYTLSTPLTLLIWSRVDPVPNNRCPSPGTHQLQQLPIHAPRRRHTGLKSGARLSGVKGWHRASRVCAPGQKPGDTSPPLGRLPGLSLSARSPVPRLVGALWRMTGLPHIWEAASSPDRRPHPLTPPR